MESKLEYHSINDLVELSRNGMLKANFEYQRGEVWSPSQKKKLIDSVLRGYPLPVIYLHHIKTSVAGMHREDLEIIDGQQRISAIREFAEGAYRLFDPIKDDSDARFPNFIKEAPCPWAGYDFHSLAADLRKKFLETELPVAMITSEESNEVRDLFVRLQAGLPLTAQDKRDAQPGNFTDFILQLGGKPQLIRYPGHPFFQRVMGMKPGSDKGKARTAAAQIAMLYFLRRENGPDYFHDITNPAIDDFYYQNIDFDPKSKDVERLRNILDTLDAILGDGKRPKMQLHHAIHLILLVDSLWDEYTPTWREELPSAVDTFTSALAQATASNKAGSVTEFWARYGQGARTGANRSATIRQRHEFYGERMNKYLGNLQPKDPQRLFGPLEREIIYFRDQKKCQKHNCGATVSWAEAEIHHVQQHQDGGKTVIDNGALVHRECHPKTTAEVEEFALNWSPSN